MQWFIRVALLPFLLVACTSSGEISIEDVEIVCVSGGQELVEVFFRVSDGVECGGVIIERSGNERVLTFIQKENTSGLEVSSGAVISETGPFAGSLLVEVPIPVELQRPGSELILKFKGDSTTRYIFRNLPEEV